MIGVWCNGSTEDFGSSNSGSNPDIPTIINQNDMKQLIDLFADPIRKPTARDCVIASVPIIVPLLGIAAVIADSVVIYAITSAIIIGVAYLIKDLK